MPRGGQWLLAASITLLSTAWYVQRRRIREQTSTASITLVQRKLREALSSNAETDVQKLVTEALLSCEQDVLDRKTVVETLVLSADLLRTHDLFEAVKLARRALQICRNSVGEAHADYGKRALFLAVLVQDFAREKDFAQDLEHRRKLLKEAETLVRIASDQAIAKFEETHTNADRLEAVDVQIRLASIIMDQTRVMDSDSEEKENKLQVAIILLQKADALLDWKNHSEAKLEVHLQYLVPALAVADPIEACAVMENSFGKFSKKHGRRHESNRAILEMLASLYEDLGAAQKLLLCRRSKVDLSAQAFGELSEEYVGDALMLAMALESYGDLDEAESWYRRCLEVHTALSEDGKSEDVAIDYNYLSALFCRQGDLERAIESQRKCVSISKAVGVGQRELAVELSNLASVLVSAGRAEEGKEVGQEALRCAGQVDKCRVEAEAESEAECGCGVTKDQVHDLLLSWWGDKS